MDWSILAVGPKISQQYCAFQELKCILEANIILKKISKFKHSLYVQIINQKYLVIIYGNIYNLEKIDSTYNYYYNSKQFCQFILGGRFSMREDAFLEKVVENPRQICSRHELNSDHVFWK